LEDGEMLCIKTKTIKTIGTAKGVQQELIFIYWKIKG
jgi:hypothetical protein